MKGRSRRIPKFVPPATAWLARLRHGFSLVRTGAAAGWDAVLRRCGLRAGPAPVVPLGERGERAAAEYLERLGFRIVARQFRCRFGELDLVAVEGERIVFVEVKAREEAVRGRPIEAVDDRKRERMSKAAVYFLKRKRLLGRPARFDVVGVLWPAGAAVPTIEHVRDAFESEYDSFYS